jgi:succinoglycan biosynthesis transport protein ExoP
VSTFAGVLIAIQNREKSCLTGQEILQTVWRMKWLVVVTILVFLGVSTGVTILLPKVYQARATVRVVLPPEQTTDTFARVQTSQTLARTYAELFKSPNGFRAAVDRGRLPMDPGELAGATSVSYVEETDLIYVQVEDTDPRQASSLANLLARTFIEENPPEAGEKIVLADPAAPPGAPVRPSMLLNVALGLLLGTVMGVGAAILLGFFRDYVSSPEEIKELVGAPILASLPRVHTGNKGLRKSPAFEEAIGTLRVNLNFTLGDRTGKGVILVASTLSREGKTTIASSLATSYAQAGHTCLLVDADLRQPQVHKLLQVSNMRGFSDVLYEHEQPEAALGEALSTLEGAPNLAILTSGMIPPNPVDLLSSDSAQEVIRYLQERFNTVIIDSPASLTTIDASILGSMADGVVLIVGAEGIRRRHFLRVADQLRSKGRILGVALNFVQEKEIMPYYSYYE